MGAELNEQIRPTTTEPTEAGATRAGRGRPRKTGEGASATDAGTGGRGTGGAGGSGATTTTEEKEPTRLAVISPEEQARRDKRNARRRELRAQKKAEGGNTKKPQKVNTKKGPDIDRSQINSMMVGLFGIIASRPKCEQWAITEEEADSITAPLCNILKESQVFEKVAEHSDQLSLAVACASVFVPRAIVTYQIFKEEKEREKRAREATKQQQERKTNRSGQQHDGEKPVKSEGPTNVNAWYGVPIA